MNQPLGASVRDISKVPLIPKWQFSQPFLILQLVKSLPFYIPPAWKRYSFRAEPTRIVHYCEYPPPPGFCYFSLNLLDSVSSVQPVVTSGHSTRPRVTILRFMLYFCSKLIFGCLFNLIYLFTWYLFMLTYIVWRKCLGLHKNFMSLRSGSVKGHHQQIDIYWKGVHDCNFYIFCAWKQQST